MSQLWTEFSRDTIRKCIFNCDSLEIVDDNYLFIIMKTLVSNFPAKQHHYFFNSRLNTEVSLFTMFSYFRSFAYLFLVYAKMWITLKPCLVNREKSWPTPCGYLFLIQIYMQNTSQLLLPISKLWIILMIINMSSRNFRIIWALMFLMKQLMN